MLMPRSTKRPRSRAFSSRSRLTSARDASKFGNSLSILLKAKPLPYAPLLNAKMIAHHWTSPCADTSAGCLELPAAVEGRGRSPRLANQEECPDVEAGPEDGNRSIAVPLDSVLATAT
jgi:hypothetical protein